MKYLLIFFLFVSCNLKECKKGHYKMILVPDYVYLNKRMQFIGMKQTWVYVCDEYAKTK